MIHKSSIALSVNPILFPRISPLRIERVPGPSSPAATAIVAVDTSVATVETVAAAIAPDSLNEDGAIGKHGSFKNGLGCDGGDSGGRGSGGGGCKNVYDEDGV